MLPRTPGRAALVVALAALAIASSGVAVASQGAGRWRVDRLTVFERSTVSLHFGPHGPNAGDQITFTSVLFRDSGFTHKIGTVAGSCTLVDSHFPFLSECGASARLAGGDIQVNGAIPVAAGVFTAPITGGTGLYAGVGGEFRSTALNASGSDTKDVLTLVR